MIYNQFDGDFNEAIVDELRVEIADYADIVADLKMVIAACVLVVLVLLAVTVGGVWGYVAAFGGGYVMLLAVLWYVEVIWV